MMRCNVLLFCEFVARSSPFYVGEMQLNSPERTLWLHVLKQVMVDAVRDEDDQVRAEALRYLRFGGVEALLDILGIDVAYFKQILKEWGFKMFKTQSGAPLAYTWEHTWEELEAMLRAGKGVLSLRYCLQNLPDFKCKERADFARAKAEWLHDVPYAYQAGKVIRAEVYANWQIHSREYQSTKLVLSPEIPSMDVAFTPPKFTWSYSALNDFENCSLAYAHKRFYKDVTTPDTEATLDGTRKHAAFEKYLKGADMFDAELKLIKPWIHVCDTIRAFAEGGELLLEYQICLTDKLKPTDWFGVDAWGRGVIDVAVIKGDKAWIFDYKTGKVREDPTQLKTFCVFLALIRPELQHFVAKNIYLKDLNAGSKLELERKDLLPVLEGLLERVARMRQAWDGEAWQARPSGLCRNYCFVNACPHCGVGGRK